MQIRKPNTIEEYYYKKYTGDAVPFCRIVTAPKLFWGKWQGITLGPLILRRNEQRVDVAVHEMVHVRQYYDNFIIGFVVKYLYWLLKYGYRKNPFEVEAYAVQNKVKEEMRVLKK